MILRNNGLKRRMKMMRRIQSWWLHCRSEMKKMRKKQTKVWSGFR